jgi:hypothetical protein
VNPLRPANAEIGALAGFPKERRSPYRLGRRFGGVDIVPFR